MSYYNPPQQPPYGGAQQPNLQFYQSTYPAPVSGHTTPSQAQYGGSTYSQASAPYSTFNSAPGFGAAPAYGAGVGVSGRMGEQGGLRTGWLAAFGTEGYDGEPPLLEELGVNFGHIKGKVCTLPYPLLIYLSQSGCGKSETWYNNAYGKSIILCSYDLFNILERS